MSSRPCIAIDEISFNNRSFYKATYMDVSVIKTNDNFYNATKIVQDNGYEKFNRISRLPFWNDFYNAVKETCVFNIQTSKIEVIMNKSSRPLFGLELLYRPIEDTDLVFKVKPRGNETF